MINKKIDIAIYFFINIQQLKFNIQKKIKKILTLKKIRYKILINLILNSMKRKSRAYLLIHRELTSFAESQCSKYI